MCGRSSRLPATTSTKSQGTGSVRIKVPLEPEVYDLIFTEAEPDNLWPVTPDVKQHTRRSIYLYAKRNVRLPMLEAFDQPDSLTPCAARAVSTFAPQALIRMNGPFARDQGKHLAELVAREGKTPGDRVRAVYRQALGRSPTEAEFRTALAISQALAEANPETAGFRNLVASEDTALGDVFRALGRFEVQRE